MLVLAAAGAVVMHAHASASAIFPCRMARTVDEDAYRCAGTRDPREAVLKRLCPALFAVLAAAILVPTAPAAAAPCVAHLSAPTHHPKAGKLWPITVTCRTRSGKAVRATATYQFVYNGQVVATRYPSPNANPNSKCSKAGTCRHSPYPFRGRLHDGTFTWPRRAVGIPLKLRVLLRVAGKGSMHLDYAVKVHR
jgi:hypothetical protein